MVPLLYEGRDVEQQVDRKTIDRWFDQLTAKLTVEQRADLKKKFASTDQLNKAEQNQDVAKAFYGVVLKPVGRHTASRVKPGSCPPTPSCGSTRS